ncbi:MAG: hypothetical protein JNM90_24500 [Burkholderiales bacterium]|nr:hypothetical protein [Burkholderiales bacterium]
MAASGLAAALREADRRAAALIGDRRLAEALAIYERMAAVAPDEPWVLVQQGRVLLLGDDADRALAHFEALVRRFPRAEAAWQGLGKACYDQHRCDDAVAAFTRAAELSAAPALARYHRGMAHLLAGNFSDGWRDYEARFAVPALMPRNFDRPRWDGTPLAGRRLLVVCEQGYGDVFQFIRCLPLLRGLGGDVVFECPGELRALLDPLFAGIEVVPLTGRAAPATRFDCHAALMSLPLLTGAALEDMRRAVPYLRASPAEGGVAGGRRVGVCWAGSPTHPQDLHRSMAPETLAPLARVPGVTLVSLQKDASRWAPLPGLCGFLAAPPLPLDDFQATARVIMAMDLVVTVDTAVAHLAGALGRPVWLLLSRDGEWRWLLDRDDSPWYPTMRIFRQPRLGDWQSVVDAVCRALAAPA